MDTKKPPLGEDHLQEILTAVVDRGDVLESDYLEIKLEVDFGRPAGKAKLAKFILGAANRLPEVAQRHFGGYAVMVIGAAQGQAPGVEPGMEILHIRQAVEPYLGPEGPRFTLNRLRLETGQEVLFLIVEPPQQGDPMHLCHRAYDADRKSGSLADGGIYVRDDGNTAPAKTAQIKALLRRMQVEPALDLSLEIEGLAYSLVSSAVGRDRYLDRLAERYRESMRAQAGRPRPFALLGMGVSPLDPSAEAVEDRLEAWRPKAVAGWPETEDKLLGLLGDGLRFHISNNADSFLEKVTVIITFHGAQGVKWRDRNDRDEWKNDLVEPIDNQRHPWDFQPIINTDFKLAGYPVDWENKDGSLVVTINLDSLPPEPTWGSENDDVVLVRSTDDQGPVRVAWTATAAGYGSVFRDELIVAAARPFDSTGTEHSTDSAQR